MVSVKIDLDKFSSSPFRIPVASRDFHLGHFFFLGLDFGLNKEDFDAFRVVVRDELCVAQLVDERLASSCVVVCIK